MATTRKMNPQLANDAEFLARRARFFELCESERRSDRPAEGLSGIGTYKEKRLHALLKQFYAPEGAQFEVRLSDDMLTSQYADLTDAATRRARDRYVADIMTDEGDIIEIQTGGFYPLVKKLHFYLCATPCRVTLVHPIAAIKHLRWMDPETGEISSPHKSPKRGRAKDIAKELYWILPYLAEERFRLVIPLIEVEEIRLQNGWGNGGKRGSERYDRFAMALCEEVTFASPEDYATVFLPSPDILPAPFTAAEYAKATGIRGKTTYSMLRMLTELCFIAHGEKRGRASTWVRI